ncbi:MAG: phosphoribosyltransferase [Rhodocyclales bacterium]|nr:phosphoribosyltransferase [Rhodocyclales bacterium]
MKGLSNNQVKRWRSASSRLLARLWPQDCFVCGGRAGEVAICAACAKELPWLDADSCPVCALPTPGAQQCGQCQRRTPHFDATLAAFVYTHPIREMVLALKFGPVFAVRDVLVGGLLTALGDVHADVIVPVPLHPRRIAERGFNQSVELARGVGRALRIPVENGLVVRDIDTPHQAGLPIRQRRKNVRGAFRCVAPIAGSHVLVIDDVITSGASLDELAQTLKFAGATRVTNLLVARTLRGRR